MAITNIVVEVSGPNIAGQVMAILPNSWKYDEGTPEHNVRAIVTGTTVQQDFSVNYEGAFSTCGFNLTATADNLELTRQWELAQNTLLITATGIEVVRGVDKTWTRSFKNASISKMEKPMGSDTVLSVAALSDAAV